MVLYTLSLNLSKYRLLYFTYTFITPNTPKKKKTVSKLMCQKVRKCLDVK